MIALAGTIGAGKTSLTQLLANHLHSQAFYESVEGNKILPLFYKDPKKYGFLLQIYFLNKRLDEIKDSYSNDLNVLDRSIFEDALLFKLNADMGRATETESDIYSSLLDNMMEELEFFPEYKKNPDLLVYLDITFENEMKNISKRGRGFEQVIDDEGNIVDQAQYEYFKQLYEAYEYWIGKKVDPTGNIKPYDKSPVLVIDANKYDVHNDEDWEEVYGLISDKMKELNLL